MIKPPTSSGLPGARRITTGVTTIARNSSPRNREARPCRPSVFPTNKCLRCLPLVTLCRPILARPSSSTVRESWRGCRWSATVFCIGSSCRCSASISTRQIWRRVRLAEARNIAEPASLLAATPPGTPAPRPPTRWHRHPAETGARRCRPSSGSRHGRAAPAPPSRAVRARRRRAG